TMAALEASERTADRRPSGGGAALSMRRWFPSLSPTTSRLLAVALVLAILMAAVGALIAIQHLFLSPTPARWGGCGGVFQCATLRVPLDYSNQGGGSIEIAITRKPATDAAHRIGSLVLVPGGPGGSGV